MNKTPLILLIISFLIISFTSQAQQAVTFEKDSLLLHGQVDYSSEFFRDRLVHNTFENFIDNYNDFIIYQNITQGDFNTPDQTLASVQGNSYRWNKYYFNGFRIDDQILPGSYLYKQDLYSSSFNLNTYTSSFEFSNDKNIDNTALIRFNKSGIGDITPGTEELFNLFHSTALQTALKPIDYRRQITGNGTLILNYNVQHKDQTLHQHLYVDMGERQLVAFDYAANNSPYYENYLKAELNGELPTRTDGFFNSLNYALGYSYRNQMNQEFYYNENETAIDNHYSTSIFGHRTKNDAQLTTGMTFSRHDIKHNDLNFVRNHMDIDGESFEPFSPDANTFELTHNLLYKKPLKKRFTLNIETYNSFIYSNPTTNNFTNNVYFESLVDQTNKTWMDESSPYYTSLYHYEWQANAFATGLLENTAGLCYERDLTDNITLQSQANLTLDGILLDHKSFVKLNWEADMFFTWTPNRIFSMGLNLSHKRIPFHYDAAKYLSNDYMEGNSYYWIDENQDKAYQSTEQGKYMTSTGGTHRTMADDLKQPSYWIIDLPILITLGPKHTFTIETSYRKYSNMWQTVFNGGADKYGYNASDGDEAFFLNDDQEIYYEINSNRPDAMQLGQNLAFLSNTPFAFVNIVKYTYNGEKSFFSVSWVSQHMINVSNIGNSPQENNIEFFSDLSANPNSQIKQLGRPHQDRGYIARLLWGYKINEHWKGSFLFKFIDGEPFSKFNTQVKTDADGNTQMATWRYLNNSTSWLKGEEETPLVIPYTDTDNNASYWEFKRGFREDMCFNFELRVSYSTCIRNANVEFNIAGYNLIDFGYELTNSCFDMPSKEGRNSIELCAPRGFMFTTKIDL